MTTVYTGTVGNIVSQEDLFLSGAPVIMMQRRATGVNPLNNPDSRGLYWGLSGTVAAPVYTFACYTDVNFSIDETDTDIQCDVSGPVGTIKRRNKVMVSFTLKSILSLETMTPIWDLKDFVTGSDYEGGGVGRVSNDSTDYWRVWMPLVYNVDLASWMGIMVHKARSTGSKELSMSYSDPWSVSVELTGYVDSLVPSSQELATIIRHDVAAL